MYTENCGYKKFQEQQFECFEDRKPNVNSGKRFREKTTKNGLSSKIHQRVCHLGKSSWQNQIWVKTHPLAIRYIRSINISGSYIREN
jgi:hypothetical protein